MAHSTPTPAASNTDWYTLLLSAFINGLKAYGASFMMGAPGPSHLGTGDIRTSNPLHWRTPIKVRQKRIALIPQVLDSNLARKKSIRRHIPQQRKKLHPARQRLIRLRILSISNQIQNLLLLLLRALEIRLSESRRASRIKPLHSAAQRRLVLLVLARQQINKFRSTRLPSSA
jgi:hypothetical protein